MPQLSTSNLYGGLGRGTQSKASGLAQDIVLRQQRVRNERELKQQQDDARVEQKMKMFQIIFSASPEKGMSYYEDNLSTELGDWAQGYNWQGKEKEIGKSLNKFIDELDISNQTSLGDFAVKWWTIIKDVPKSQRKLAEQAVQGGLRTPSTPLRREITDMSPSREQTTGLLGRETLPSAARPALPTVPKRGGVVQEFTGDTLTKETQIQPSRPRQTGIFQARQDPIDLRSPRPRPQGLDELEQLRKSMEIPAISTESINAHIKKEKLDPESFRDSLNTRFNLQEEAIAERDGVSKSDVKHFVWQKMKQGVDPESLLNQMMDGQIRVPPKLTDEIIKIYTDQGISEEEVKKRFNSKHGTQP